MSTQARSIIAGEIAASGSRPAAEVADRILARLAAAGLAPGAAPADAVPITISVGGLRLEGTAIAKSTFLQDVARLTATPATPATV
ncbi:hypothetical protein [Methylobacterium aquaticum]|uniref:Uncharacterized protein n=1 Tax=Methylobacterium aquaticum TaxID=270351 RepID=A0A0C6FQU3_9HYPH|nr:hypothetical protein [Methylobacterium aquaticum]BAQ47664.1 hypothetical protein Maq22A_c23575 [Methylobacterium aquaticum]